MAEREAIYKLKFLVDKGGQQASVRAIDALSQEFDEVNKNAQAVGTSAQLAAAKIAAFDKGRAELHATADEAKQAAIDADGLGDALSRAADASADMRRVADEAENARKELQQAANTADDLGSRLDQADERFSGVSKRVALAGDVQSNLGAIRGLSQVAGAGGAGQVIGATGEIVALAEELPRLKTALQGMPAVLKAAYSEIGAGGVGLIGALAVLGLALNALSKQAQDNRNKVSGLITDQREFDQFVSTSTKASLDERKAALVLQLETEKRTLEQARTVRNEFNKALGDEFGESGAKALTAIDNLTGAFGTIDQVTEEVEKSKGNVRGTEAEIAKLNLAYADQGVIARSLAEDERQLAAERAQADVNFYQTQYDLQLKYHDLVTKGNQEQLDEALAQNKFLADANRERQKGYFADIEALKQSGQEVPEVLQAAFDATIQASSDLNREFIYLTETATPLVSVLEQTAKTIEGLESAHSTLTSALGYQEDAVKNRIAQLKEQAQAEIEFGKFLKSASAESVQARIAALQEEAAALRTNLPELERMAKTSTSAAQEFAETTDRLSEIDAQLQKIGSQGVIAAIQHEQEQLTAEIIKIEAARDEKIAQIRAQAAQKELDLFQDLQRGLAEAVAEAQEERADAQRDYIEKSAEIEQDLARKRLDIQKKFGRSLEQAIDDRDALAANQAKQTRDDELEDAEDAAQEQRQTLEAEYQKQLETIDRELTKQQQTLQAKYAQQLNDLRQQTAQSISMEQQKAQQEISTRQQAYQQELALLQSFAQSGVTTISAFAQGSVASLVQFSSEAQTILAGFVAQASNILGGLIGSGSNVPTPPPPPSPIGGPQQPFGRGDMYVRIEGYTKQQIHAELNGILKHVVD